MNLPVSPLDFRAAREVLFSQTLAHLKLAQHLPLRVICAGIAHYVGPDLEISHCSFEREVDLGTCKGLAEAMALATSRATHGETTANHDGALRLAPQFVTVIDAERRLVLAGEVRAGVMSWCAPVAGDVEARAVVLEASHLRAEASAADDRSDLSAADAFRLRARLLEGRLVDPFWREIAGRALGHDQAA